MTSRWSVRVSKIYKKRGFGAGCFLILGLDLASPHLVSPKKLYSFILILPPMSSLEERKAAMAAKRAELAAAAAAAEAEEAAIAAAEAEEEERWRKEEEDRKQKEQEELKKREKEKGMPILNMPERVELSLDEAKALFKVHLSFSTVLLVS